MKVQNILLASLAAMALAACGNEDEMTATGTSDARAKFTASIEGVDSRANGASWDKGDRIGISGVTGDKAYDNVAYATPGGDGDFSVVTPGAEIYYQDDNPVTFTAYYPWSDLQGTATIAADTKAQAGQKGFDFLWARATGSKASPNVALNFTHRMAKVALTVHRGDDVSLDEVKAAALSLSGFRTGGAFSVADGAASATGDALTAAWTFAGSEVATDNAPLSVDEKEETVTYSLIVFPQELASPLPFAATLVGAQAFKTALDFTEGNRDAGDENPTNAWVAGRQYNLSVTLHKTSITVDGCVIAPWSEVDAGKFDAK